MLDTIEWMDDYPVKLTASERAVARQALVDAYFKGFDDGKNGRLGDVFVDQATMPSWIKVEEEM